MSKLFQNVKGQKIDYETFKTQYDSNPALQRLVQDFNNRTITIKTTNQPMPSQSEVPGGTGAVDAMAKQAAKKMMNR